MASRSYNSYKFIYTNDFNLSIIKRQRVYLDENNNEITPITPLFLSRVVNFQEKVTGTSQGLRYLLAYIGMGRFQVKLPYNNEDSELLKNHIQEVLEVDRVICADYFGERQITGGSTTNIQ